MACEEFCTEDRQNIMMACTKPFKLVISLFFYLVVASTGMSEWINIVILFELDGETDLSNEVWEAWGSGFGSFLLWGISIYGSMGQSF